MKNYYKVDFERMDNLNLIIHTPRQYGRIGTYYFINFRRAYAKERKKLMGEIILTLSVTLILTVVSSFWLGYSYGKLRTIKSYEAKQIATYEEYLNSEKETDNDSINSIQ